MYRFKIVFHNSQQNSNLGSSLTLQTPNPFVSRNRNISLNAPMIDRVHKARPGCSACGKKVA